MENLDTNELIEQYLSGTLSAAQQQEVETRLITDVDFRAEVDWQRQLYQELADPQKLQLRDLMSDIVQQTPVAPPTANSKWLKGLGLILLILFGGWLAWLWLSPPRETPKVIPQQEEIQTPSSKEPVVVPPTQDTPAKSSEKTPAPIAMADPADFLPNRDFEARLGSTIRTTDGSVEMQSPTLGANFTSANGFVKINFRGTAPADDDVSTNPLVLKIYSNRADQPLFNILPVINDRKTATGRWNFSSSQRLRLKPGLYYFTIERKADEDLVFVGKFTVGVR